MGRGDRAIHTQGCCEATATVEVRVRLVDKRGRGALDGGSFPLISINPLVNQEACIICALDIFCNFQRYKNIKDDI